MSKSEFRLVPTIVVLNMRRDSWRGRLRKRNTEKYREIQRKKEEERERKKEKVRGRKRKKEKESEIEKERKTIRTHYPPKWLRIRVGERGEER